MTHHFFLKLIPRRPTFPTDITPDEQALMQQHVAYWTAHMQRGRVHLFGPVMDPAGVYGIGILSAETREQAESFAAADPAVSLNRFEIYPMRAILPTA